MKIIIVGETDTIGKAIVNLFKSKNEIVILIFITMIRIFHFQKT